jgi:hypothetical protein
MSTSQPDTPDAVSTGEGSLDRIGAERVVTTTAERYVMSGGRAERLAVKEGDLFLYTNALGHAPGTETPCSASITRTPAT